MAIDRLPRAEARVTEGQREAIEEAMRIIVEEDRERGVDPFATFGCRRCGKQRQLIGSVDYEGIRLCNSCATRFEMARMTGKARSAAAFVGQTTNAH
ncbi:MAG: hypothetical protein EPO22_03220 [Dehalococcoidia bacterium]|nr:MAG: hypothetical protein EPO22_03220 [Dehalococcoidia bacterium]